MATQRITIDASMSEDADLSNAQVVRRSWDVTTNDAQAFGPVTLPAGSSLTVPMTGVTLISEAVVAVRGGGVELLLYYTLPTTPPRNDIAYIPVVPTGTSAADERVVKLGPFPVAVGGGWLAEDTVTRIDIVTPAGGTGATVRGWVLGT